MLYVSIVILNNNNSIVMCMSLTPYGLSIM